MTELKKTFTKGSKKKSTPKFSGVSKLLETLTKEGLTAADLQLLHDIESEDAELKRITLLANEREVSKLVLTGWLEGWTGLPHHNNTYILTLKASVFMGELEALFIKPKKQKVVIDVPMDMVIQYNETFPKVKIPTSGKYARTNPAQLAKSFAWFLKEYPQYTWETILQATQRYVAQKEQENWNYMRTSGYFLRKQDINKVWSSDLADFCMQVVEGIEDTNTNHFEERVV